MRPSMRLLGSCALLAALTLAAWLAAGQAATVADPRNRLFREAIDARCYQCHLPDDPPFVAMGFGFAEAWQEVVPGVPWNVTLQVGTSWGHQLWDIVATLDAANATGVRILTEPPRAPFEEAREVRLQRTVRAAGLEYGAPEAGSTREVWFPVAENATRIHVVATTDAGALAPAGFPDVLELALRSNASNTGRVFEPHDGGPGNVREILVEGSELLAAERAGNWTLEVSYAEGYDPEIVVTVLIEVSFASGETLQTLAAPVEALFPGESTSVAWTLLADPDAGGRLDVRIRARAHYDHSTADSDDDGTFLRFATLDVRAGDHFVRATSGGLPPPPPLVDPVDVRNLATRVAGFSAALLVPLSLVTGGVLGKGSRRAMNRGVGGARRRILWHSAASWGIVLLSLAHLVLALVEARFVWTKGLLWGGLGLASLASLGFTGALQVRIIKRWGFRGWRLAHLSAALAVVAVGLLHILADGSDLGSLRERVPVLERLSWP